MFSIFFDSNLNKSEHTHTHTHRLMTIYALNQKNGIWIKNERDTKSITAYNSLYFTKNFKSLIMNKSYDRFTCLIPITRFLIGTHIEHWTYKQQLRLFILHPLVYLTFDIIIMFVIRCFVGSINIPDTLFS